MCARHFYFYTLANQYVVICTVTLFWPFDLWPWKACPADFSAAVSTSLFQMDMLTCSAIRVCTIRCLSSHDLWPLHSDLDLEKFSQLLSILGSCKWTWKLYERRVCTSRFLNLFDLGTVTFTMRSLSGWFLSSNPSALRVPTALSCLF